MPVVPFPSANNASPPGNEAKEILVDYRPAGYFAWAEIPHRILAALMLVAAFPLIACIAVLVRMTSPGPAIYRQQRLGLNGRPFLLYKLRTMRRDAEIASGPVWCQTSDSRITRLGRFLRDSHLDELPQLWNVVKGEMSLVGPRPERPEFIPDLIEHVPGYLNRLSVLPGVTGLAQINLPADTDYDSVRRKIVLDLEYASTGSLMLDARIILSTGLGMLPLGKRRINDLFGLYRNPALIDSGVPASQGNRRSAA